MGHEVSCTILLRVNAYQREGENNGWQLNKCKLIFIPFLIVRLSSVSYTTRFFTGGSLLQKGVEGEQEMLCWQLFCFT